MMIQKINKEQLFEKVKENILNVDFVGDIGCGNRSQDFIKPKYYLCIDLHKQYLDYIKEKNTSNNNFSYINLDWGKTLSVFPKDSIETIFLLDVIEHGEKNKAIELIKKTEELVTKQIIILSLLGFIEQKNETEKDAWGLDGGKCQEHKSGWVPEDFGEGSNQKWNLTLILYLSILPQRILKNHLLVLMERRK